MATPLSILRKRGLLRRGGPAESAIERMSLSRIVDTAQEIDYAVNAKRRRITNPLFSYSASLSLGGDSSECAYIGCRIRRVSRLARFALMYADKVFVSNPFSWYKELTCKEALPEVKKDLIDDLKVIYEIAPLLEKGHIRLFSPHTDVCTTCQATKFLGEKAGKRFRSKYGNLKKQFLDHMSVECEMSQGEYALRCHGPSLYFDHARILIVSGTDPTAIASRPRILRKIQGGNKVVMSKTLIRDMKLHADLAHNVSSNALHGLATSHYLNTTFLTEHDLHVSFLNSLHDAPAVKKKNALAAMHLSSTVPFLEDVSLRDIIKLRKREQEAFLLYRQALNQTIGSFTGSGDAFRESDARALYGDVLGPQLAALDKKVKLAKRDLVSKPLRSLTGVVGVISFGLLTGLVSPDISALVQTVGIVKFGSDLIKDVMALGDKEKVIEADHLYFLWKVKKKTR